MTETLYPHESPFIQILFGLILLIISGIIAFGIVNYWFIPQIPITYGMWETTINMPPPSLFGVDPIYWVATLMLFGLAFIIYGISITPIRGNMSTIKYCPHCKRRL